MAHYKVTLEDTKHITTMEFYGKDFPLHPEEFSQFESLWQEDYARFLLQKDIGLLTIYYAKEDISLLWESNYNSIHAIYQHLNHQENPFAIFIYGDNRLWSGAYDDENGITVNPLLSRIRDVFNEAYLTLFEKEIL